MRAVNYLGNLSYPFYLVQVIVMGLSGAAIMSATAGMHPYASAGAYLAVTAVCAALVHHIPEALVTKGILVLDVFLSRGKQKAVVPAK
jgi:peptidoglycan/LPS O-acetylase OafA/YrhL